MKRLTVFLLMLCPYVGFSQLLSIVERNNDGKNDSIKTARRILDLNSSLHLIINKKALNEQIARESPPTLTALGNDLISRMASVRQLLQARKQTDSLYRLAMLTYARSPNALFAGYDQFVQNISLATRPVLTLLTNYPEIKRRYTAAIELVDDPGDPLVQNELTFAAAEELINEWEKELDQQLRDQGAYVQMGAWLVRPSGELPLHLEGFDSFEVGQRYVIDRFAIALTDNQKKQLEQAVAGAKVINNALEQDKKEKSTGFSELKKKLISEFRKTATYQSIDTLRQVINALKIKNKTSQAFQNFLEPVSKEITSYQADVEKIIKFYESPDSTLTAGDLLIRSNDDLVKLTASTKAVLNQLKTKHLPQLKNDIAGLGAALKSDAQRILANVNRVQDAVEADIDRIDQTIGQILKAFQSKSFDATALRFTEKVAKIALDKLPSETDLHIVNSGIRDKGDLIVIRIGAGFGEGAVRYLETHEFPLYKVLPHIETSVGIILSNPSSNLYLINKSKFQAAASYSVLAKGLFDRKIRQRSSTYHNMMDIGIGLNVSAPDFDRDDIPELGVGLVLSLFRDYVQGGIGYNVFLDKRYGFFGLRLPLPSFSLVGSAKNP